MFPLRISWMPIVHQNSPIFNQELALWTTKQAILLLLFDFSRKLKIQLYGSQFYDLTFPRQLKARVSDMWSNRVMFHKKRIVSLVCNAE